MAEPSPRVVVVGGGLSGLATAYFLKEALPAANVVVLEGKASAGGNVRTLRIGGAPADAGPDAILVARAEVASLCGVLDPDRPLLAPRAEARRVNLGLGGQVVPLPEGLALGVPSGFGALVKTPLISPWGKARAALDLLLPRDSEREASVGSLIERRLGKEIKDKLVEPLLGAIYAADIDRLDAGVGMPFSIGAKGSLLRALALAPRPSAGPPLRAPRGGMAELVSALCQALGPETVRPSSPVRSLRRRRQGGYLVETAESGSLEADSVVLAVPPGQAARLLESMLPDLPPALSALRATSTASVLMAFPPGTTLPPGSGLLLPRTEGRVTLAATFLGSKWGRPSETGEVVVRALLGGARAPDLAARESDGALVSLALEELRAYVPLPDPTSTRVVRYLEATPQPEPGHGERVARVRALTAEATGLHLVQASYGGPGAAGCAAQAKAAATAIRAAAGALGGAGGRHWPLTSPPRPPCPSSWGGGACTRGISRRNLSPPHDGGQGPGER